jgi:hypothetical protein
MLNDWSLTPAICILSMKDRLRLIRRSLSFADLLFIILKDGADIRIL